MGFWSWLLGNYNSEDIITKNNRVYKKVEEKDIPQWVWKKFMKMERNGATAGSFKGKEYRYIIQYSGAGMYDCWKRKRGWK